MISSESVIVKKASQTTNRALKPYLLRYGLYGCAALLLLPLAGCGGNPAAPVSNATSYSKSQYRSVAAKPGYHLVKKGDTLYSIAFRYGLDYKQLARWNGISSPYLIRVGERLWLYPRRVANRTKSKETLTNSRHTNNKPVKKTASQNTQVRSTKTQQSTSSTNSQSQKLAANSRLQWQWPVKGQVVQKFSPSKGKKGIDIAAAEATLIKAAEGGKVVYGGNGLRGYGLMVIIKHNEQYLSAYAHNKELLVKEGDWVKPGQSIARMGKTATDRTKLHFEIRKSGTPVDPLRYLPK